MKMVVIISFGIAAITGLGFFCMRSSNQNDGSTFKYPTKVANLGTNCTEQWQKIVLPEIQSVVVRSSLKPLEKTPPGANLVRFRFWGGFANRGIRGIAFELGQIGVSGIYVSSTSDRDKRIITDRGLPLDESQSIRLRKLLLDPSVLNVIDECVKYPERELSPDDSEMIVIEIFDEQGYRAVSYSDPLSSESPEARQLVDLALELEKVTGAYLLERPSLK